MLRNASCSRCAYSSVEIGEDGNDGSEPLLECRRYPPRIITGSEHGPEGEVHVAIAFPSVTGVTWCGEFIAEPGS